MQEDESSSDCNYEIQQPQLRRSVRKRKLTGPIKAATHFSIMSSNPQPPELTPELLKVPELPAKEKFDKLSEKDKMGNVYSLLSQVYDKLSEVDITLHDELTGICTRLTTCQTQADNNTTSISAIKRDKAEKALLTAVSNEVETLKEENIVLKGLVQRQHNQIRFLNDKVTYLTKKLMENNIVISGLEGDNGKKENCLTSVTDFFKNKLKIEVEEEEILVAHRSAVAAKDSQSRSMIVRCTMPLKERILRNVKNLRDAKNPDGGKYFINKQVPDVLAEQNRQIRDTITKKKLSENGLPFKDKTKIEVKKGEVFFDSNPAKTTHLLEVQPLEMFPERAEKVKWHKLKFSVSDMKTEAGSEFIAYATKVTHFSEVKCAYRKIKALNPAISHIIAVYNLKNGYDSYQDDGEIGAGHKLAEELKNIKNALNVAVFVCRMYNRVHMGYRMHKMMVEALKQAVLQLDQ